MWTLPRNTTPRDRAADQRRGDVVEERRQHEDHHQQHEAALPVVGQEAAAATRARGSPRSASTAARSRAAGRAGSRAAPIRGRGARASRRRRRLRRTATTASLNSVIDGQPGQRHPQRVMVKERDAEQRRGEQDEVDRYAGDRGRLGRRPGRSPAVVAAEHRDSATPRSARPGGASAAVRREKGHWLCSGYRWPGGPRCDGLAAVSAARRFLVTRIVTGRGSRPHVPAARQAGLAGYGSTRGPDPCFSATREALKARYARGRHGRASAAAAGPAPHEYRQQGAMALTRSISRLDLAPMPQTVGEVVERGPLLALSQRKLNALGTPIALHRPQPALSLRQQGVPRLVRQALRRGARPRDHRGRSAASATSSTAPTSKPRSAASAPASSGSWRSPGRHAVLDSRRLLPRPQPAAAHIRGFLATYSDVDHLKRLELEAGQREHRLRLVTDSVGLPILHFDRQLRLRFANKPFADWIGVPAEDLLGHPLHDFLRVRRADGNAGLHRARVRRRHGLVRAARAPRIGRAALGARHAVSRPRDGRSRRRRVRRAGTTSRTTSASATR